VSIHGSFFLSLKYGINFLVMRESSYKRSFLVLLASYFISRQHMPKEAYSHFLILRKNNPDRHVFIQ